MKKRKIGERANILFDDVDLNILNALNSSDKGLGVLELVDKLKLKHKNLKPHIDKLFNLELIHANKNSKGKVSLITLKKSMEDLTESEFDDHQGYQDAIKQVKEDAIFLKYLQKADGYRYNKEMKKLVNIDLRKKEEINNKRKQLKSKKDWPSFD